MSVEVVNYVHSRNMIITPGAASLLENYPDFRKIIDEIHDTGHFVVTEDLVKNFIMGSEESSEGCEGSEEICCEEERPEVNVVRTSFKPLSKEYDAKIRFFDDYDVTGKSFCEGTVENFLEYFRNRFEELSRILRRRPLNLRPLSSIDRVSPGNEVDVICMVYEIRESKQGNILLDVEDTEERRIAIVPKEEGVLKKVSFLLPDDVVALRCTVTSSGFLMVRDVFWPDVDGRVQNFAEIDLAAAITSDWHVGSKLFLKKQMDTFIKWLKGEVGNSRLRDLASRVKFLLVNGDVVDGVGIYPSQINELEIKDIFKQYHAFCRIVEEIPDHIEIIVGPGNHDAVRRLDPQPALPKDLVGDLWDRGNVHFVGSPSYFSLEGVEFLMYHGTSLDDVISRIPSLEYTKPEEALRELLRRRHLVPTYGLKQPIVPERKDYMLIHRVPDVFTCGHVHKNGYLKYKGVNIVVSGTFQDQTPFQVEHGHVPTPGVVPVLTLSDLVTHQVRLNGVEYV